MFDRKLNELYLLAGAPSTRTVAGRTGVLPDGPVSRTSVHTVLYGGRLPSWRVVSCVITALGGDVETFQRLWVQARQQAGDEAVAWRAGTTQVVTPSSGLILATGDGVHGMPLLARQHGEGQGSRDTTQWAGVLAQLAPDTGAQVVLTVAVSDPPNAADVLHELCRSKNSAAVALLSALSKTDVARTAHLLEIAARRHIGSVAMMLADSPDSVVLALVGAIRRSHRCLLPLLRSVLGESGSPGSLTARHEEAARLDRAHAWSRSAAEYQALLTVRLRLLGSEHRDTLATRLDLGRALGHLDRWREAALQFRVVMRCRRRALGDDHADTLDARYRFVDALRSPGQLDSREAELRSLIQDAVRVHGEANPFTLRVRYLLAAEHHRTGRIRSAERDYRAILKLQSDLLGAAAPDTLATHQKLGLLLADRPNQHAEADRILRRLVRVVPAGHPDIPVVIERLAVLSRAMRHYGDEASWYQELLQLLPAADAGDLVNARRVLGIQRQLATVWRRLGRTDEAEAGYRLLLAREGQLFGSQDLDTLCTQLQLAHLLRFQERLSEAAAYYESVYQGRRQKLGASHRDTLAARHHLATALNFQGELPIAASHYRAVLIARRRVLGPDHRETLATWHRLAANAALSGQWSDAERFYRELLDARCRVSGPYHPKTSEIRRQLEHLLASQVADQASAVPNQC